MTWHSFMGSPRSQELGTLFYNAMIKYYGFSEKLSLKDLVEADSLQSIGSSKSGESIVYLS